MSHPGSRWWLGILASWMALAGGLGAQETPLPEVVAEVNGEPITRKDWLAILIQRSGQQVLEQLIDERIVEQALRARGIRVEPAEVERRLQQLQETLGGPKAFQEWLLSQNTDLASFRHWLELDIGVERLVEKEVRVSEEDIQRRYLQENRRITLYHVRVKTEAEAREYRQRVLQKVVDFPSLARTLAQDPLTELRGGLLGTFNYDGLPPAFADIAFALKVGEVSEPIKTEEGYYLLYVSKIEDPPPLSAAERERIQKELHRRRLNEAKQRWLQEARQRAQVKRFWPAEAPRGE